MNRSFEPSRTRPFLAAVAVMTVLAVAVPSQGIGGGLAVLDANAMVEEKLGQVIDKSVALVNEDGQATRSGDWFTGKRPVILNLGYFGCPRVCGAVLNGLMAGLAEQRLQPGQDYDLVTVSFDAREKPALATAKKASYRQIYPALPLDSWRLCTGDEAAIRALCKSVGFGFAWNEHTKDFDHSAVTIFLSPDGKVTRYLYGTTYQARDLRFAILESAEGKVGSVTERILLSCYGYDPTTRRYEVLARSVMQVGGVAILIGLGILLTAMWRGERRRSRAEPRVVAP